MNVRVLDFNLELDFNLGFKFVKTLSSSFSKLASAIGLSNKKWIRYNNCIAEVSPKDKLKAV